MTNSKAINLVMMFGFNYSHNFISEVWNGSLAIHLQSKFDNCYKKYGSIGVFSMFYTQLDNENREQLVNWILANYKG
jgi:hypothetical protein